MRGYSPGFWLWAAYACILTLLLLFLLAKTFSGGTLARQAIATGQRVTISIADGEALEGTPRHTRSSTVLSGKSGTAAAATDREKLAPAPLASISEQSDKGVLPISGSDGTLAWRYYSRPFTPAGKRPLVAVVLTNMGLSRPQTEEALKLPHGFTFSFSPYAGDARTWVDTARGQGFESLVDLPMQPSNYPVSDPGPYGLLENLDANESRARLHWVMSRFSGYVGLLAPENETLTANIQAMRPTLTELNARGVLFVYLKTPKNAGLVDLAKSRSLMLVGADAVIDSDLSVAGIDRQLQNLVDIAKKQGMAVGIAHSYPPTLQELSTWSESLPSQGVDLAPISAIAARTLP